MPHVSRIRRSGPGIVRLRMVLGSPGDVRLQTDARVVRTADARSPAIRYVQVVNRLERQLERLRSMKPIVVDGTLAALFTLVGVATVFGQDVGDDHGRL